MSNTFLSIRVVLSAYFIVSTCLFFPTTSFHVGGKGNDSGSVPVPVPAKHGTVVTKDQRLSVVSTEFGEISGVKVSDGRDGFYHLQFIIMEPNSLFIPVHLHSDMVFYVNSGSGTLSWVDFEKDKDKLRQVELRTGDVYRLTTGSFFYLQSNLNSDSRKFRINAIFSDSKNEIREGSSFGAYSSVADLLLGFDDKVLQAALNVNEEVIQELKSGGRQPMIVHGESKVGQLMFESHYRNMRAFLGFIENGMIELNKKKKDKDKAFNILEAKHDFENCNGWSLIVTSKQTDVLKDSDFGVFMVNLSKGAMMGPHWNPMTAEIGVGLSGRGMLQVVCPSNIDEAECKNLRFRVEEGDVFVVPRYHPMAQISFNNGSFVFVGFTTTQKNNHPQYLAGSASVFQVLDRRVLAASLGVSNTTMDEMLSAQNDDIILECTSCAEEEERLMEEEIQRQKEEEEREKEEEEEKKKEEEEARKREEEEARKREKEEEEARKREEEEEARKREEEEEEARKREEEEEEEAARKREEEEEAARKREEEEAAKREQEEAAAKRREEEEAAKRREEEEAEAARRQEEEAEAARRQEEEAAAKRRQEEEAARQQEEEEAKRWQEEEEAARQHKAADRRTQQKEETETRRRQQEEEAAKKQEDEAARWKHEQDGSTQQKEPMRRREEEKVAPRAGGEYQGQGEGQVATKQEEDMEKEMARREKKAESSSHGGGGMTEMKDPRRM